MSSLQSGALEPHTRTIFPRGAVQPALLAVAIAALGAPFALGGYGLYIASSGGVMALGAMALTVLSGSAGLPSLGTAAFMAIGAFSAGILATQWGLGMLPALLLALVLGFAAGAGVALLTLRVSGLYLAVGTLALQHVVQIVATDLDLKFTYASGFMLESPHIAGLAIDTPAKWWGMTIVLLLGVYVLFRSLQRGHVGREWALLRMEPTAAATLGVSPVRARLAVFALTSAVIAASGAIDGYRLGNVQATGYSLHLAIMYLTVVALGGAGGLVGAVVASYAIVVLPDAIAAVLATLGIDATTRLAGIDNMLLGALLVCALLDLPARARRVILRPGAASAARREP